jgi:hypothetical protein
MSFLHVIDWMLEGRRPVVSVPRVDPNNRGECDLPKLCSDFLARTATEAISVAANVQHSDKNKKGPS